MTHQHRRSSEHVRERVIDEVQKGCRVQIRVPNDLATEKGLSAPAAEQRPHHAVGEIHLVGNVPDGCPQL